MMRRAILIFYVMAFVGIAGATDGDALQLLRRWGDALVAVRFGECSTPHWTANAENVFQAMFARGCETSG